MDRHFGQQPQSVRVALARRAGESPAPPEVDDDTAAYILETRRPFEDLRQVASQLAGLLVLAAAGSKSAGPHHPMLESARQLYQEAADRLNQSRPTARASRHHGYLCEAAEELRTALAAAHTSTQVDPVLIPLKAAYAHLQFASHQLPGFEMVAFDQGCCGGNS